MDGWLIWFYGIMGNRMNKKRICLVIPSLQAGGMERVMSELAWYFSKKKELELHLLLYGKTREIFYSLPENIIIYKPAFPFNNSFRFYYTLKTIIYLRTTVNLINPDSILSFGEYWNSFVLLSLLFKKYPVFISERSQPDKSLGKFQDHLRKWLYPKSSGVILQSQKAKQIYQANFKGLNIRVIGNPIRNIRSNSDIIRENQILMVGRLIRSKHQDNLIKIFASINNKDWKLVLVGYDHLKQNNMNLLKKLALECGVEDRVVFAGKQNDVDTYYLSSKIFAFTSSSEGFPNAIGEAMAAGLPVVAYDCVAGPSEMIRDGENGFLVPVFDDTLFAEKLNHLMLDEAVRERLGKKGNEDIKKFNIQAIGEQFYQFIISGAVKEIN